MKKCNQCGIVKPFEEFNRDRTREDGRRSNCKLCHNSNERERDRRRRESGELKIKDVKLGMSHSTASSRLRKMIMFKLAQELGHDICYRCYEKIETLEEFSVDHKVSWQNSQNPVDLFFDLNNISFSHLGCNISNKGRRNIIG